MKYGAVIAAAGMPAPAEGFKPLVSVGAMSAARRIVATLQQAGAERVVVVTGSQAEALEHHLSGMGVVFLRNQAYESTDMFHSASIGLAYLASRCMRILFTPVDVPLFTAATARKLLRCDAPAAVPVADGVLGHPMMLSAETIQKILPYTGSEGLRGALRAAGVEPLRLSVQDPGVLCDTDAAMEYSDILESHTRQMLRPLCDVRLAREAVFLDGETARFLRLIDETGAVRAACDRMNISYSRAWHMLDAIEKNYGAAVQRRRGGVSGGASALTPAGAELLARYTAFEDALRQSAGEIFSQYFGDKL